METLESYDRLPYESLPIPQSQPDLLAALARLHGLAPPDPASARVLELGCAGGGNLAPLAWRWPASRWVGVELSRVQAQAAAAFIDRLGLKNARVLHADLAQLPAELGPFDYIIAHGVYSWAPPPVRQALLDLCRERLAPDGLAYVSFNVAAGWKPLLPLRKALLAATSADAPPAIRCGEARAALEVLARETADAALREEIVHLQVASDAYLFHEYLAEFNEPVSFAAFAAQLDASGLRYAGDAGARRAVAAVDGAQQLAPETLARRWLDAEAALDEALGTRFRRALLCRADGPVPSPPQAEALSGVSFYADLVSDEEIDLDSTAEQRFVNAAGQAFPVALPLAKAGLMALSSAYPDALAYDELAFSAQSVLAQFGASPERDEEAFRDALFALLMAQAVLPTVSTQRYGCAPGERPRAHALARLQAATPGCAATGARHEAVDLDAAGRALLSLLDGSRSLDELAGLMRAELAAQGHAFPGERVREMTERQLWTFARHGLLAR